MSAFSTIACCLCGTSIEPNEVAMCLVCLRGEVNITDGIGRHAEVVNIFLFLFFSHFQLFFNYF